MKALLWVILLFYILNKHIVSGIPLLEIRNDYRKVFGVISFGFLKGGSLSLTLENYELSNITSEGKTAFYIRKGHSYSNIFTEDNVQPSTIVQSCYLENSFIKNEIEDQIAIVKELPDNIPKIWNTSITVEENEEGLWEVLYINCKESLVTFNLTINALNPGNNHLSIGDSPLPLVYGLSAFTYILVAIYWTRLLTNSNNTKVFRAHWLMLVLIILMAITKILLSAKYHYTRVGLLTNGWIMGLYIFGSIKGILGIILIMLLASGWVFVKPFLSVKDKIIIYLVIPLQEFANCAIFLESVSPMGSVDRSFWNTILPFLDLAACIIILWTILQTRKTLSAGISADGKEKDTLNKYKLWSSLYVVTLIYMYVTRIVVQLLQAALPFQYVSWFGEAINESATILFFIFIGSKFRPYANNPYMQLATEDMDDEETDYDHTISNNGLVRLQPLSRKD